MKTPDVEFVGDLLSAPSSCFLGAFEHDMTLRLGQLQMLEVPSERTHQVLRQGCRRRSFVLEGGLADRPSHVHLTRQQQGLRQASLALASCVPDFV
jgi:hypothetical protein